MKNLMRLFGIIHGLMAFLFACAALMLIAIAAHMGWMAFAINLDRGAAQTIIEAIGLLAAAVVALQIAQTTLLRKRLFVTPTSARQPEYDDFCPDFLWLSWSRCPSKGLLPRSVPYTKIPHSFHTPRASWLG